MVVVVVLVVVVGAVVVGAVVVGAVVVAARFPAIEDVVGEVGEGGRVGKAATVVEVDDEVAALFAECVVNPPLSA